MRFYVEPSPAGGYFVKLAGTDAPVSRHDTEEALPAPATSTRSRGRNRRGENVRLRDGSQVLVRPVRPNDKPLFVAGFERLSDESRYLRFMGYKKVLTLRDLEFFTELDHEDHEAIGAIDPFTGEGLAVARYMRLPRDPTSAEAAVAVIDAWQGRGLGSVLFERLVERAPEQGIQRFKATLFTDNKAMLALFQQIGDVEVLSHEGQTMKIEIGLPTEDRRPARGAAGHGARRRRRLRARSGLRPRPGRCRAGRPRRRPAATCARCRRPGAAARRRSRSARAGSRARADRDRRPCPEPSRSPTRRAAPLEVRCAICWARLQ